MGNFISRWIFWLVQLRYKNKESQKHQKKQMSDLCREVICEIDYNITPGVGNAKCQFKVDAIHRLIHQTSFDSDIRNLASKSVNAARLCNGSEGQRCLKIKPGNVKGLLKQLKDLLKKQLDIF